MRSLFYLICLLVVSNSFGQTGNYFLSHYSPSEERFDYVCFDMAQDDKGVMYFATKAGIMEFDGRDWELLQGPSAIYSIRLNAKNEMYWAGSKGFGKVSLNIHGFQEMTSLSAPEVQNVFQILVEGTQIFFLTEDAIYILDEQASKIEQIKPVQPEDSFTKLFELFGVVYVNSSSGIYKVENNKLAHSKLNFNEEVVFFSRLDDDYVIGTSSNKLYSCNESLTFREVKLQDQSYIDASVIVSGSWFNRQLLALGTLRGGVIFVNPLNGLTQEITNYATGLPDNEVFQLMTDVNQNVWVAHDYGFTRIAPFMPLRSFSYYEGLQGNLLCTFSSANTVYVGTSLGLFRLDRIELYDELTYYVDVEVKPISKKTNQKQAVANTPAPAEEPKQEVKAPDSKRGGLFSFLRKKNKAATSTTPEQTQKGAQQEVTEESQDEPAKSTFRRVKKTEKILRSSHFVFKKVQGIDSKVTHIAEVQGKLIAAGLGGLYEVSGLAAKSLLEDPIRYMYAPAQKDFIIISTYEDEVRSLRFAGTYVENSSVFNNLQDQIHYIFENGKNELWFCGIDKMYRADMKDSDIRPKQTIDLKQNTTDKSIGAFFHNEVIISNTEGFFKLNRQSSTFEKLDTLSAPSQYFAHNGGIVYRDSHGWHFLSEQEVSNLELLNVFKDIRFISSDKINPQNLWLVSGDNHLFKFFGDKIAPFAKEFPLYLKSVMNQDKKIVNTREINMDQEHSSVVFKVVQPDYINPAGIEFRYRLQGMKDEWTEWSTTNNLISFPYLPTGEYTLQVQAKNIFGKLSDLQPLSFEVLPPYWKRPWFYALEFSILASMVVASFRLNTKYRIVSRLLSLLTIILLIEFIQTAIGSTIDTSNSPVIEFIVQVVVALLVLPVEGYLRNLMLRSLDSSGKFYQFIVPKSSSKEKPERFIKETSDVD